MIKRQPKSESNQPKSESISKKFLKSKIPPENPSANLRKSIAKVEKFSAFQSRKSLKVVESRFPKSKVDPNAIQSARNAPRISPRGKVDKSFI